jgi:hypothetical protein
LETLRVGKACALRLRETRGTLWRSLSEGYAASVKKSGF